jgi:hypothetical protein
MEDGEDLILEFDSTIQVNELIKGETEIEVLKEDPANSLIYLKINNFYFKGKVLSEEFCSFIEELGSPKETQIKLEVRKEALKSRKKVMIEELVQF